MPGVKLDVRYVQVIVWVISLVVLAIGGVLYLEHRHQAVIEVLAEAKADLRHLDKKVDDLAEARRLSNDRIYKALDALQSNDKELALQVIEARYCCEMAGAKGVAKKKVKKRTTGEVLPYALKFKDNPGVIVVKTRKE